MKLQSIAKDIACSSEKEILVNFFRKDNLIRFGSVDNHRIILFPFLRVHDEGLSIALLHRSFFDFMTFDWELWTFPIAA